MNSLWQFFRTVWGFSQAPEFWRLCIDWRPLTQEIPPVTWPSLQQLSSSSDTQTQSGKYNSFSMLSTEPAIYNDFYGAYTTVIAGKMLSGAPGPTCRFKTVPDIIQQPRGRKFTTTGSLLYNIEFLHSLCVLSKLLQIWTELFFCYTYTYFN